MQNRRDRSAGVIVFHRGPEGCRYLLLRSRLTRRPLWEFPKGGLAPGESAGQAALRELQEETGLTPADVRLYPGFVRVEDYRFLAGDAPERLLIRKEVTYFLAESFRTEIVISEAEASRYAWLTYEEARIKVRYAARRAMLDEAAVVAGCRPAVQRETRSRKRVASKPAGRRRA